jgi:hypothetical protein
VWENGYKRVSLEETMNHHPEGNEHFWEYNRYRTKLLLTLFFITWFLTSYSLLYQLHGTDCELFVSKKDVPMIHVWVSLPIILQEFEYESSVSSQESRFLGRSCSGVAGVDAAHGPYTSLTAPASQHPSHLSTTASRPPHFPTTQPLWVFKRWGRPLQRGAYPRSSCSLLIRLCAPT